MKDYITARERVTFKQSLWEYLTKPPAEYYLELGRQERRQNARIYNLGLRIKDVSTNTL